VTAIWRHRLISAAQLARDYAYSLARLPAYRHAFDHVRAFCLFVGYPRSGHTLVGSLLDAHRHAVIGLELDVLRYVRFGFNRAQIFLLLAENAQQQAKRGRQWTGYSYHVPNQWQGRAEQIRVIGDKRGGETSRRLARDFGLLERLRRAVGLPLKVVHVVRDPYDNIATMCLRGDAPDLDHAIDAYFRMADTVECVQQHLGSSGFISIHHEDIVVRPVEELSRLCDFVGLRADNNYLKDCASIIFKSPNRSRAKVGWTTAQRTRVAQQCLLRQWLARYADWSGE
jgi:hypothetical protein